MVDKSPLEDARFRAISFYWLMKNKAFSDFYHQYIFTVSEEEAIAKQVVKKQLYRLFKRAPGLNGYIAEYWSLDGECVGDVCIDHLLKIPSLNALRGLERVLTDCFEEEDEKAWLKLVRCSVDVAKWILLLSVNPEWLAQNNMLMGVYEEPDGDEVITLAIPVYGEIVISRWLMNLRPIGLNKSNIVSAKGKRNSCSLFSAVSKEAAEEELLMPLFKDIQRLQEGEGNN